MLDFYSARVWARELVEAAMAEGAAAIDATMGNGNDTEWLCGLAGESGRVYAFDIQETAVENTRQRLSAAGLLERAELRCAGHEKMAEFVPESVDAVVFNLGWLPGARHIVTTRVETTLAAAESALGLLKNGGVMTICVYPGHDEGAREKAALLEWAAGLEPKNYDVIYKTYLNQPKNPPCLIAVQKRHSGKK